MMFNIFGDPRSKTITDIKTKSDFEPGDIVSLKSSDHRMVVSRNYYNLDSDTPGWFSVVVYFNEKKNRYYSDEFRQVVLKKV